MLRSDPELLDGLAARRDGAFEELVEAYTGRLYGLAWRVTGSREDAEEAVQDALGRAHGALLGSYSPERVRSLALKPWLYAVTLNAARNRRRGRRVHQSLDAPRGDGAVLDPAAETPGPPALAERAELAAAIEAALGELSERQRTAIVLRWIEGLTYDEAAAVLGRPAVTIRSDVHRGLRALRGRLDGLLD